jgi:hypothetical protein
MKKVNIPKINGIVCTSILLNTINISFALDHEHIDLFEKQLYWSGQYSHHGYKPVLEEYPDTEYTKELHENSLYKKWCEETFTNGNYIYEGYRDITFNIKYAPEANRTDNWQTPLETARLGQGDCEDVVFLFFSHLPPAHNNAEIVWGWVIDGHGIAKAHVWYQLTDIKGEEYIVEGFSNDWKGIIPMNTVRKTETRKPIIKITHLEASRLLTLISRPDSWNTYQILADLHRSTNFVKIETNNRDIFQETFTRYHLDTQRAGNKNMSSEFIKSWNQPVDHRIEAEISKKISKIYRKLYELFVRYEERAKTIKRISRSRMTTQIILEEV